MADNQGNFISKFVPKSHFFTDPATVSQTAEQAFGPGSASEFRITGSFNISAGDNKVYAICRGVVLVQPQAGSNGKVNVIMRPYTQPIQGFNIKYFIYRGLNMADFFTGNLVKSADGTTSDFINNINASFLAFHTSTDPEGAVPDFLASYIGFDPVKQAPEMLLSDLFFKQSEYVDNGGTSEESGLTAFELPNVAMGATLGTFVPGECGIDVVLNYGDYKLPVPNDEFVFDLAYARAPKVSITTPSTNTDFQNKVIKEQIFQFLDVAAYFGFHAIDTGTVVMNVSGAKVNKKGTEIYDLMVSKFFTKNRLYLYIQSDRTRSYNFYGNYAISDTNSNSLKFGLTEDALAERAYGTNGWPLIIDESAQTHDGVSNTLYLQLVTDNNVNTMLYGQVAEISNAQSNNFCGADYLASIVTEIGAETEYTKTILIANGAASSSNLKLNIATFNFLIYQGKTYVYVSGQTIDEQGVSNDISRQPIFFDDVFGMINAIPLLAANEETVYSSTAFSKINLINHFYDKTQYGISAVQTVIINDEVETGIASEPFQKKVTYITESIDILGNAASTTGFVSPDTRSTPSVSGAIAGDNSYSLPIPFYFELNTFTDIAQTISGLTLNTTDGNVVDKLVLGILKSENDKLVSLISTNNLLNSRLCLIELFSNGNELVSAENVLYQKYNLCVVGEKGGTLKAFFPQDLIIYSIDKKVHFSKDYSQYIQQNAFQNNSNSIKIDLTV